MERIHATENENVAKTALGLNADFKNFNMKENSIDSLLEKEKAQKFNSEIEKYNEMLEENDLKFKESLNLVEYDINKAEIKPLFARLLVQPFKVNPFLKMKVQNGIIVDTGGYNPHTQFNDQSGKYEEQDQFIVTGCVVETGPEVKYLKEGDVIYYRRDTAVPVPFFKQGFVSLAESQVIATVAENLTNRFNNVK